MSIGEREVPLTGVTAPPLSGWAALRPLVMRLHFYAGVFVAPFLLIAAISGIAYVYTPQLEQAIYAHELRVPDAPGSISLDRQARIAQALVPEGKITGVRPGPTTTDSTQVIFDRPGLEPSWHYTVFVNPHDGEVRGQFETYGSGQAMPIRGWVDNLHRNLFLGDFGRLYSELAASWLWVIVLGGLALWIGRRHQRRRELIAPVGGPAGRKRLLSWHGAVGLWAAAGLLFLSATGLTWSLHAGASISDLRTALNLTTPSVSSTVSGPAGVDIGVQAAFDATVRAGLSAPVEVRPPSGAGKGYVVQQVGRSWPVKADSMVVDPATGAITDTLRFADYPLAAKLTTWGINAHMGLLFGLANQIALTLLAAGLICLVVWGYRMWWHRRPTRGESRFGRPPVRGAWRRVPGRVLAPVVVVVAVIGYYLPVLGVSLLGFLVVDLVVGLRAKQEVAR
jgi:uncharacterized iron-regulated membrane protein